MPLSETHALAIARKLQEVYEAIVEIGAQMAIVGATDQMERLIDLGSEIRELPFCRDAESLVAEIVSDEKAVNA